MSRGHTVGILYTREEIEAIGTLVALGDTWPDSVDTLDYINSVRQHWHEDAGEALQTMEALGGN